MRLGLTIAAMGLLFCTAPATASETEFDLCQGASENAIIRIANCDLAIRIGGLTNEQMIVALFNRGQALLATEKPEPALADFEAILKLTPDDKEALFTRAIAHRQLKHYDSAIADFDRLAELKYEPAAKLYLQRSMAHHLAGNKDKALADLKQAKTLDPDDPVIIDRLWKTERLYSQQAR